MIHTARNIVKYRRLVRALQTAYGCSRMMADTLAVGTLEKLWHLTCNSARRGDIGRISDIEIADELGWEGDPEIIVNILIETEWIDTSDEYRLVIHDWHDHAPGYINKNIHKVGGYVTGVRKRSQNDFAEEGCNHIPPTGRNKTPDLSTNARIPNETKPNQTKVGRHSKATSTKDLPVGDDGDDAATAAIAPPEPFKAYRLGRRVGKSNSRGDEVLAWKLTALAPVLGEAWFANLTTALELVTEKPKKPWAYVRTVAEDGSKERPGPGKEGLAELLKRVPGPPADWPGCCVEPRQTVPP